MAVFKKNIYLLFWIVTLLGAIAMSVVLYDKGNSIDNRYLTFQEKSVQHISSVAHALFATQELTLDLLGQELLNGGNEKILDKMISMSPSIIAFAFADVNGNIIKTSANLRGKKLPNLKQSPESKATFIQTLNSDVMILGKTYYFKPLKAWVIPTRKRLKDKNGKIIGVMIAGFSLNGVDDFFNNELHTKKINSILFVRDLDRNIQFISSDNLNRYERYHVPVPANVFYNIMNTLSKKYGMSIEQLKKSKIPLNCEVLDKNKNPQDIVMQYDERYRLWIVSIVKKDLIIDEFYKFFIKLSIVFLIVMTLIYYLFRNIYEAEEKRKDDLKHQATHDTLTSLPNRNYIKRNYTKWTQEGTKKFALMYIDMDRFKNVNDSFGHGVGDIVLVKISKRLRAFEDINSKIIREGGDEFIFLTRKIDKEALMKLANQMIDSLSKPYKIHDFTFSLGASIGVSIFPEHGKDFDSILRSSDIAMYKAKKHKNFAHMFTNSMQKDYLDKFFDVSASN